MEVNKYIIIGGVAAGASAAVRLRRLDEKANIIILDKGQYVSYSNCSLPYRLSETIDSNEKLVLMDKKDFSEKYNIEVRTLNEVIDIDEGNKQVLIKDIENDIDYCESYDKLIITPGSKSIVPQFEGLKEINCFTLKTVDDTAKIMQYIYENIPKHITVIGGGFIGVEVAENLNERGIGVTLVEGSDQLMQSLDFEISLYVKQVLEEKGIEVILKNKVKSFTKNAVILENERVIETDAVVLSIGVAPNTSFLKKTTIELTDKGYINVNQNYQTSNKDIYAAGDAILVDNQLLKTKVSLPLAGPANKQGRLIADHIKGKKIINKGYIASSVIKVFDYTFASTGLNEKQIKSMSNSYNYNKVYISAQDKVSLMPNNNNIVLKLIFDKDTGVVLGAQGFSKGAVDKRIDVLATAIKFNATVYDLLDLELAYAPHHGTGKDVVNKIGYQAANLQDGLFKQIFFTEVYDLILNNDNQLIDVRENYEYDKEHINGFENIPLSEIRSRLDEIDKSKKVYVSCRSGYRSYNAVMILRNLGYDAYNVAGGYILVSNYEKEMQKLSVDRKNILN